MAVAAISVRRHRERRIQSQLKSQEVKALMMGMALSTGNSAAFEAAQTYGRRDGAAPGVRRVSIRQVAQAVGSSTPAFTPEQIAARRAEMGIA